MRSPSTRPGHAQRIGDPLHACTVHFDAVVPGPDVPISGTYSGVIQKVISLSDQVILLGVSGCFEETLQPTH